MHIDFTVNFSAVLAALFVLCGLIYAVGQLRQLLRQVVENQERHDSRIASLETYRAEINARIASLEAYRDSTSHSHINQVPNAQSSI